MPIAIESGPAIASPTGRSNMVPIASNEETLERASRGTSLAIAVDQIVIHKSSVIPQSSAQNAMNQIDCGLARDHMYNEIEKLINNRKRIGYLSLILSPIIEPINKPIPSKVRTSDQDFAPLNSLSAIKGPKIFSPAAHAKIMNENPKTPITIQRKEIKIFQP